jgi:hypothetical protein
LAVFQCQGTPLLGEIDVRPDIMVAGRNSNFHEGDAHPGDNSFWVKCQGPAVAVPATGRLIDLGMPIKIVEDT